MKLSFVMYVLMIGLEVMAAERTLLEPTRQLITALQNPPSQVACPQINKKIHYTYLKTNYSKKFKLSVISYDYLLELFKQLASRPDIPFGYPDNGCYARAHAMVLALEKEGVIAGKVFAAGELVAKTENSPRGYVEWSDHVAPVVVSIKDGKEEVFALDPSLFDRPVPVKEWYDRITPKDPQKVSIQYFTPRFQYAPDDAMNLEVNQNLKGYRDEDLLEMRATLEKNLINQEKRFKELKK
ncbi:MAG: protein-glutamine glutaminase family protein [Bacteriovoracaceae bacterium]